MTITVGTPVKAQSLTDVSSLTLSNFVVGTSGQLLLVWVFHEGAFTLNDSSVTFGGAALTKVLEVKQTAGNQTSITIWALANPTASTASIVVTMSAAWSLTFEAMLVDGADLSSGITSAINTSSSFQTGAGGTDLSANINPTINGTLVLDAGMINDAAFGLSEKNSQSHIAGEQVTGGSAFTYKIGKIDGGSSGTRSLGYTSSGSYARASYGSIAIKSGAAPTLSNLTFTSTTTDIVPGENWSASIAGRTSGSTITAACPGETVTWNSGTNTLSANFTTAGTKVITLTETLTGATNTPHVSPAQQTTVLIQVKVGIMGSSTPAQWTGTTFATAETPHARLRLWNGSTFAGFAATVGAGKGPGGVAFGNYLISKLGSNYRVDLVNPSLGGTGLQNWSAGEGPPNGNYPVCVSTFLAAGGVDFIVCHLGSNDARAEQVSSRTTYEGWYRTLISNVRSSLSAPSLPFFLMGCQRAPLEPTPGSDIHWARARAGEQNVADEANVYLAATAVDLGMYSDNVHLSEAADGGNAIEGRRAAYAIYNSLFPGAQRYKGPKPGTSNYDPATGWVTINFATSGGTELVGRASQDNLTGFAFFAAGSPVSPTTAPFVSGPAQVAGRLAAGLSNVTYAYQETTNPDVSNCLFDNGPAPAQP